MHRYLARYVICPIHERLLRRPTFRYLGELERSQWDAPADLQALQRSKLRQLLRHAQRHTPFYRRCFREAGIDPDQADPIAALGELPLLDKRTIRTCIEDMLWRDIPGGLVRQCTGGSTGEPLTFYVGRRRQAYDQAARLRSHRWFNVNVGDRELFLWGSPIEATRTDGLRLVRDALFNQRLLSAFDMSSRRMDAYLDEWDRYRPAALYGYPSSIALFVEHAEQRRRRLDTRRLKAVFVTGEVCYPHHRDTIASYFGLPVADGYGSREAGFIAHQCPQGSMHLCAENVIVEIVDREGEPMPVGETGEIVVTHLDAYAMPLIRYRTGDAGRLKPGRCACGRGLPLMDVVQGRSTDFLHLPDGTVKHALAIIYPLREMRGVRRFRVTQHVDYSVTVAVVADDQVERITREAVARKVRPVVGGQIGLSVELVDRIASAASGKHRYVVSHVGRVGEQVTQEVDADA